MFLERLTLTNFRCFGPTETTIGFTQGVTAFVGANGAGKTVVMQALQRLFGVTGDQRRIRRQDFHVPASEEIEPQQRSFVLEAVLAFPELDVEDGEASAVPEFFPPRGGARLGPTHLFYVAYRPNSGST
jgi:predicted ATP-dependent endonuclease of OLD family